MAAREAELLPIPYFHVVFTLPSAIGDIAYQNKAAIYDLLFKASSETMLTIAADPKHLGARIGITSVLHSWGSAMTHHPHLHMIVPAGGLSMDDSRWISCKPNFLLPVRVLSKLFRRLLSRLCSAASASWARSRAFSFTSMCSRAACHSCGDTIGGVFIASWPPERSSGDVCIVGLLFVGKSNGLGRLRPVVQPWHLNEVASSNHLVDRNVLAVGHDCGFVHEPISSRRVLRLSSRSLQKKA
jgi:hypothetical protein